MIYNVAEYLKERKKFKPQEHKIEGLDFTLIPLLEDMIQELKVENAPYDDMLVYAATRGVSVGRERVFDDAEMSVELADMWTLDQFEECEPSLIHQVGLVVCEISGLSEFVEDQKKLEAELKAEEDERAAEAKAHLSDNVEFGVHAAPGDIDITELDKNADDYKVAS